MEHLKYDFFCKSKILIFGISKIWIFGKSKIWISGKSKIWIFGKSKIWIFGKHTKENSPASRQQSADLDNNTISVKTLGC